MNTDARRYAPSAQRNREPILGVLLRYLPPRGLVLEVASGTGEHIVHFAQAAAPGLVFQPSDADPSARASIDAWVAASGSSNVRPAIELDARSNSWPLDAVDAVLCANMVHIAPWAAAAGLFSGAGRVLSPEGFLFLYGPFRRNGAHTAPSNAAFDESLRAQNPEWGVRDLEALQALAAGNGFAEPEIIEMPANNLVLIFRRR
jgi:SAM-dependent methyltransferase